MQQPSSSSSSPPSSEPRPEAYVYGNVRFGLRPFVVIFHNGLFYLGHGTQQRPFIAALTSEELIFFLQGEFPRYPDLLRSPTYAAGPPSDLLNLDIEL